jgi:hypothetical protein
MQFWRAAKTMGVKSPPSVSRVRPKAKSAA